ncbi:phage tail tape measure protein [Geoalkalibacter sp.]|uniref:phage tail tape measure protein n=1 Tax=Geoalkalibacter sp. TaxID=3041440 RepID=UPI00272E1680|nr:phage tail tape measure protein [Geoalkalibacter sp.]
MADLKKTVEILFKGTDQATGVMRDILKGTEDFSGKLGDVISPAANLTEKILKMEAAALAAGAAITLLAVKTAGDFDAAFREIATLIDVPLEGLGAFRQGILDYSTSSTQSLEQITGAIYGAISAGTDYKDSLAVVKQAEQLAVASKANLQETLVLLVSSLNAYGEEAGAAQRYSDALFTTVKQGQTTLPELASSLAQVTGLAATAGVDFEVLLSAIAALTAAGLPTSQSITGIRAALSNIIKPSKDAEETARELGIEFNAAALQSKGFEGVLGDVGRAAGGNVDTMAKLFGSVEGLNVVLTLTGLGAEKFNETLTVMRDNSGATAEAFEKMAGSLGLGSQTVVNAFKNMLIAIGDPLLDEFGGIQQALAAIMNAISGSLRGGELAGFVAQIEGLARAIESTLLEVAKNLPKALASADYSGFFNGIDLVQKAVSGLFDGASLTSAEGLAKIIGQLGLGFQTLAGFTAGAIQSIGPFVEKIADLAGWIVKLNPEILETAGKIGGVALAVNTVLPVFNTLLTAVIALGGVGGAIPILKGALTGLVGLLSGPAGMVVALAAGAYGYQQAANAVGDYLDRKQTEKSLTEDTLRNQRDLAAGYEELAARTGLAISSTADFNRLTKDGTLIYNEATGLWETAATAQQGLADGMANAARTGYDWNAVLRQITDEHGNLIGAVTAVTDELQEQGKSATETAAAYHELRGTTPELARRMAELEVNTGGAAQAFEAAEKESERLRETMLKLASDERIRAMELSVDLNIAQIEADTQRISAAFASVDGAIAGLNTGLVDMVGLFAGVSSSDINRMAKTSFIQEQTEQQNRRLDEQLRLQKELITAQVENMRARTEALRNGDGVIKVESTGLEPALEMILWNVLEKVQMRVNEEAAEFLIGMG